MKKILSLLAALMIVGCASTDPTDYTDVCNEIATRDANRPPLAGLPNSEEIFQVLHRGCVRNQIMFARNRNRELGAMGVAIVFGAASDALATHNFYTYRVPEARRYLEGNR